MLEIFGKKMSMSLLFRSVVLLINWKKWNKNRSWWILAPPDTDAMKKAIEITDRIIVPVPPSQADIWSTQRFIKMVLDIRGKKNMPQMLGFVNRADTHIGVRETGEAEDALKMLPHIDLIDTRLYQRTTYRRSFSEGLAVFELKPKGKAAAEVNKFASMLYPWVLKEEFCVTFDESISVDIKSSDFDYHARLLVLDFL